MPNFDKLADIWDMYTYPWRPGKKFLNILETRIPTSKNIAIFGSTPEFRHLIKKHKKKVDVYDTSIHMLEKLSVGNEKEHIIEKDWFHITSQRYDLILGDLIFGLVKTNNQSSLFAVIHNNLGKNGIFILRNAKKKKSLSSFHDYLNQKCKEKFTKRIWNEIIFNSVIGFGLGGKEIHNEMELISPQMAKYFDKYYIDICPYGNTMYNELQGMDNIKNYHYLLKKDWDFVEEQVLCFGKDDLADYIKFLNIK